MDELIGKTFNYWTIESQSTKRKHYYVCRCNCGTLKEVVKFDLLNEKSKNCGCVRKESVSKINKKYKNSTEEYKKEYGAWRDAKRRCYKKNHIQFSNYGGRGITMCERWLESFDNFMEDMGKSPNKQHSLDRINNNGNYEPKNCRWTTTTINNSNKRKPLGDMWGIEKRKNGKFYIRVTREGYTRRAITTDVKSAVKLRDMYSRDYLIDRDKWIEDTKNKTYEKSIL